MTRADLSYLARYLFVLLIVGAALVLVWRAFQDLMRRMRGQQKAANGFFLLSSDEVTPDLIRSLPLYHTTVLGKAESSDIRLRGPGIQRRHALIYLFDGEWLIRPAMPDLTVTINGVRLLQEVPLAHRDVIGLGDLELVFISERQMAAELGQQYEGSEVDWQQREIPEYPILTGGPFAWTQLLLLAGLLVTQLRMMPLATLGQRALVAGLFGAFFLVSSFGYLAWPRMFKGFDTGIYTAMTLLAVIGLIVQARLSLVGKVFNPSRFNGTELAWYQGLVRDYTVQAGLVILGFLVLPLIMLLVGKVRLIEKLAWLCFLLTPLLYVATLIFGRELNGAKLWIFLPGGFSLQLTEFAKITWLVVLALFFKNRPLLRTQILFAVWAGANFFLILLLPDLGSAMILLPVTLVVFAVMTSEYLKTALILLGGGAIGALTYLVVPHVRRRLDGWLTLWDQINDANRQIVYGLQAVGRGGLLGRGFGNGSPEGIFVVESDMIFTLLCEEFGLLIGMSVVILFIVIWLRGAKAILLVRDGFSSSLILGLSTIFFVEAAIVIAGSTGLIPLTGVTLPLIAKGGSSLIAKMLAFGMLLGLCARREQGGYRVK